MKTSCFRLILAAMVTSSSFAFADGGERDVLGVRKVGDNQLEFVQCHTNGAVVKAVAMSNCQSISGVQRISDMEEFLSAKTSAQMLKQHIEQSVFGLLFTIPLAAGTGGAWAMARSYFSRSAQVGTGLWGGRVGSFAEQSILESNRAAKSLARYQGLGWTVATGALGLAAFAAGMETIKGVIGAAGDVASIIFDPGSKSGTVTEMEKDLTILLAEMEAYFRA